MPGYRGHLIGGSIAYLVFLQLIKIVSVDQATIFSGFFFCLLGSLFPDVDIKSKGQKIFYLCILLFFFLFLLYERTDICIGIMFVSIVPLLVKHRGIFHNYWFLTTISMATAFCIGSYHEQYSLFAFYNGLFFLVGSASHVFLDRTITRLKYFMAYYKK